MFMCFGYCTDGIWFRIYFCFFAVLCLSCRGLLDGVGAVFVGCCSRLVVYCGGSFVWTLRFILVRLYRCGFEGEGYV